jgi:hypothetical protein
MIEILQRYTYELYIILICLILLLIVIRRRNIRVKKSRLINPQVAETFNSSSKESHKFKKIFRHIIVFCLISFGLFYVNRLYAYRINSLEMFNLRLKEENNRFLSRIDSFYKEMDSLYVLTNKQQERIKQLENSLADDTIKVPANYYFNTAKDGTLSDLVKFLNEEFTMPVEYKMHIFDCSEKAAFMERELENAGFDSVIVLGNSPNGNDVKHAWLFVFTSDNYKVAIEPTVLLGGMDGETQRMFANLNGSGRGMIYCNDNPAYYDDYDYIVSDIYEAIDKVNFEEFDWWYGMWDLEIKE